MTTKTKSTLLGFGFSALIFYIAVFLVVGWTGATNAANACVGTYSTPYKDVKPQFINHHWQPNMLTLGTTGSCIVN
jgi:hypothetical protein